MVPRVRSLSGFIRTRSTSSSLGPRPFATFTGTSRHLSATVPRSDPYSAKSASTRHTIHQLPLQTSYCRFRSLSTSSSRLQAVSCAPLDEKINASLPPIRYHVFRNPLPYQIGLDLQNQLVAKRLEWKRERGGGKQDLILFLEHIPTYTTGRRDNTPNPDTLHPEEKKVQHVGAEFHITKRGGQVTYHGPGQLVGYPLLDLNNMEMPTRCYVDYLQSLLADYIRSKGCEGILAPHPEGHVGVFASPTEKIASIGIHLQHRITSHGFAMNITPEPLKWFDLVLACGLADVHAVDLHDLMTRSAMNNGLLPSTSLPAVREVAAELVPRFEKVFGRNMLRLEMSSKADSDFGGSAEDDELGVMSEMIEQAEEDAKRSNEVAGGWPSQPDLSRQAAV